MYFLHYLNITRAICTTLHCSFLSASSLSQPVFAQPWSDPTAIPPNDNASTPVNISATAQVKAGGFGASALSSAGPTIVGGNLMVGSMLSNPVDPISILSSGTYGDAYGKWAAFGRAFSAFPFFLPATDYGWGTAWDGSGAFFGLTNSGTNKKDTVIGWGSNNPNPTNLIYKYNGAEVARMTSGGNLGLGTSTVPSKLTVAGTIQSTTGGIKFPDGTTQTTAASGGQWITSGTNIYNANTGNVGVGTVNPNSKLHVVSDFYALPSTSGSAVDSGFRIQPTLAHGEVLDMGSAANASWIQARSATNYATKYGLLLNPNGGNVGIGTTVPSARLEVADLGNASVRIGTTDNRTNANLQVKNAIHAWSQDVSSYGEVGATDVNTYNNGTSPTFAGIFNRYYGTSAAGTVSGIVNAPTAAGASVLIGQNSNSLNIGVNGASPINFFNSGGTKMTVLSNGNVGVGLTSPVSPLQVYRSSGGDPSLSSDATNITTLGTAVTPQLAFGGYGTSPYGMWMQVKRNNNDGNSYPLIINPLGGNVGIGTPTPGQKLSVAGTIESTSGGIKFPDGTTQTTAASGASSETLATVTSRGATTSAAVALNGGATVASLVNNGSSYFGGNVGISTVAPNGKLDIGIGNDNIAFYEPVDNTLALQSYLDGQWNVAGYAPTQTNLALQPKGGNVLMPGGIWNTSGNVGIGTAGTNQKLSINGGIGFANVNDADKKLYAPADGDLEWFTNSAALRHGFAVSNQGTKQVYLNTSGDSYLNGGNVGIGTPTPSEKLDVVGGGMRVGSGNFTQNVNHGNYHVIQLPAANNGAGTGDAGLYSWVSEPAISWTGAGIARNMRNSGAAFSRINPGLSGQMIRFDEGNGINFTTENSSGVRYTPVSVTGNTLCLNGDCRTGWPAGSSGTLQTVTDAGNSTTNGISVGSVLSSGNAQFGGATQIGTVPQGFYGDGGNIALRTYNSPASDTYFQTYGGGATNMIIKNDGRVGIGIVAPAAKLNVSSGDGNPIALINGTTKGLRIGANAFGSSIEGVDNTGTGSYQPLYIGGSDLHLTTSGSEKVTINGSGDVGVGVSPSQKLTVAGTVYSTAGGFKFPDGTTQTTAASSGSTPTIDAVLGAGSGTDRIPRFNGGIDLGNGDSSGGASDTAGIKTWNTLNLYSSWSGATYTNANNWGIQFNPRNGNATFKGSLKIAGGSPGDGKVLTSDASGNASWSTPNGSTATLPALVSQVKRINVRQSASCDAGYIPTGCSAEGELGCTTSNSTSFKCEWFGSRGAQCLLYCMKLEIPTHTAPVVTTTACSGTTPPTYTGTGAPPYYARGSGYYPSTGFAGTTVWTQVANTSLFPAQSNCYWTTIN
jgi:hypothetical protein